MMSINPFEVESPKDDTNVFGFSSEEPEINPFDIQPPNNIATLTNNISAPTQNNNQHAKKYNIIDMYWLVNQKLFNQEKLDKDEVSLLIISYNADFNNLRIAFHEANSKSFNETSIIKYETKQITTVNLFSETAQKVLYNIQSKKFKDNFSNFERIFTPNSGNNDWKPNASQIEMNVPQYIKLKTKFNNTIYSFTFLEWQIQAFLNAMKFMTDGNSWKASLSI